MRCSISLRSCWAQEGRPTRAHLGGDQIERPGRAVEHNVAHAQVAGLASERLLDLGSDALCAVQRRLSVRGHADALCSDQRNFAGVNARRMKASVKSASRAREAITQSK